MTEENKYAFIFEGVGVEYQSMINLLTEEQKKKLQECCLTISKEIDMDLWNFLFNNSTDKYDPFFYNWIAIYTIDYIVYQRYIDAGMNPEIFIGYSLGLITASACGKAITFADGLNILLETYKYSKTHQGVNTGSMAVIIGMTHQNISKYIEDGNLINSVSIASENNEYCIVISGVKEDVNKIMKKAEDEGAIKVKDIDAPFAFHSKYAKKGIEDYIKYIEKMQMSDSQVPIISAFDQKIIQNSDEIKSELIRNMASSMGWRKSIETIIERGITNFVEISLSNSITKSTKIINTDCNFLTYDKVFKIK